MSYAKKIAQLIEQMQRLHIVSKTVSQDLLWR